MNDETLKTETTPVEHPVEAPAASAPSVAPAAPSATGTAFNPMKYFLKSNIFRAVTVLLMIVYLFMALYLPVFTVSYEDSDALAALGAIKEEGDIHFSLMDVINDLGNEMKLCYLLDDDDMEDVKEYVEIQKNAGKFTDAVTVSVVYNALREESENDNYLAKLLGNEDERGIVIIAYIFLPIPFLFLIGLAISSLISLIKAIISFFKPSAQVKKLDASVCLTTTIFFALSYFTHLMLACFNLNLVIMGVLVAVSIAALITNAIYKAHTTKIINERLGL